MIINNVKLVLENEVVHGSLEVQDGEIRAFAESQSRLPEAMDGEGGWLLMSSHDALMVASGITTVLDAVAIGDVRDGGDRLENPASPPCWTRWRLATCATAAIGWRIWRR